MAQEHTPTEKVLHNLVTLCLEGMPSLYKSRQQQLNRLNYLAGRTDALLDIRKMPEWKQDCLILGYMDHKVDRWRELDEADDIVDAMSDSALAEAKGLTEVCEQVRTEKAKYLHNIAVEVTRRQDEEA